MNYASRRFSARNVLEYFFWFKSRMPFHASAGMVSLGGSTVFIRRDLLERDGGWDQHCPTEDAEIGIRLSADGVSTRVIYDDRYVTGEETPPMVGQFVKQRTHWDQGLLRVVGKGQASGKDDGKKDDNRDEGDGRSGNSDKDKRR